MNMNFLVTSLATCVLLFATSQINAKEVSFPQCPQKQLIRQVVETHPIDGWKIINSHDTQSLRSIGVSAGEYPAVKAGLDKPIEEKQPNGDVVAHYEVFGDKADFWAVCAYTYSHVVLTQKLPANIVRCEVKYRNDHLAPDRVTIKCFDTPRK